jgi:hypothetical protein
MDVDLGVNAKKSKYMLLSRHQNVGQYREMKIPNRLLGNVAQIIYFGTAVRKQNLIKEGIRRRLNGGNYCYHQSRTFCLLVRCVKA